MADSGTSRNGVPIRLTDERWSHIEDEHAELVGMRQDVLETVADAEQVLEGGAGELLAVRTIEPEEAMVVIYLVHFSDFRYVAP